MEHVAFLLRVLLFDLLLVAFPIRYAKSACRFPANIDDIRGLSLFIRTHDSCRAGILEATEKVSGQFWTHLLLGTVAAPGSGEGRQDLSMSAVAMFQRSSGSMQNYCGVSAGRGQ